MVIPGVGQVFHRGEYWMLMYDNCRHQQYFQRSADRTYAQIDVEARVRQFYATCSACAWAPMLARLREEFGDSD